MHRTIVAVLIFAALPLAAKAQEDKTPLDPEGNVEERIENVARESDEETDFTELAGLLKHLSEHPINLNHTTREELLGTGLLDEIQVKNLLDHIARYGSLVTLEELQTVEGFTRDDIDRLLPYVTVGAWTPPQRGALRTVMDEGKHLLIMRSQRVLEDQKGYQPLPEGSKSNAYYLGDPWKLYTRYRFTYRKNLSLGVTAEKDQGEEFFTGSQSSFDFYSAHLFVSDWGPVKALALGDYQLAYGQGLAVWTGLAFGKSSDALVVKKNAPGIRPYTSVNESLFKRGAAVSVGKGRFALDAFYSHKGFDGNLTDTLDQVEFFSSFLETGFHRSVNELADKNSITEDFFGGHAGFRSDALSLGVTAVRSQFDKSLSPSDAPYNAFAFRGDAITNTSVDYGYLFHNISFFGEVARSDNGGVAYLNGALISLDRTLSVSVLNRNYGRDYQALQANAFREGSRTANEKGTYFGIQVRPRGPFELTGYFDAFAFPWLRYQVDGPTAGYEGLAQLRYKPNKQLQCYVRFRQTTKPENVDGDAAPIDYPVPRTQRNYRFDNVAKISKSVTLHNRVEVITVDKEGAARETGYLILQDVAYRPLGSRLSFSLRYALFDTKSYDSRLYAYENDVLYAYSIPAYYYRGARYYITLRYKIAKGIDAWLRLAQTAYANRQNVGSGLDEIGGNQKTEVKMQVRFQF